MIKQCKITKCDLFHFTHTAGEVFITRNKFQQLLGLLFSVCFSMFCSGLFKESYNTISSKKEVRKKIYPS